MKIFKAEPIESKLDDLRWARSEHKKWVIVRAENEDRSMTLVERKFDKAATKPPAEKILAPPWGCKDLVNWTEINVPKFPSEGKEGIIAKG